MQPESRGEATVGIERGALPAPLDAANLSLGDSALGGKRSLSKPKLPSAIQQGADKGVFQLLCLTIADCERTFPVGIRQGLSATPNEARLHLVYDMSHS